MGTATTGEAGTDAAAGFRGAMRRLASGVAIVVAEGREGPVGMAATSITSLTMDPPAVLVCVNRSATLHACLAPGCPITVNLLSRHQRHVSSAFGGGVPREKRFEAGEWNSAPGLLPMLRDAQANLTCKVESIAPYGTHSIVIASVDSVRISDVVDPLIYQDGAYL
jgi:flavin reductase (DIM6/NTAB) family NADH-FMN oxidoreductase RutF